MIFPLLLPHVSLWIHRWPHGASIFFLLAGGSWSLKLQKKSRPCSASSCLSFWGQPLMQVCVYKKSCLNQLSMNLTSCRWPFFFQYRQIYRKRPAESEKNVYHPGWMLLENSKRGHEGNAFPRFFATQQLALFISLHPQFSTRVSALQPCSFLLSLILSTSRLGREREAAPKSRNKLP